jgi:anti-anti-sigma factor
MELEIVERSDTLVRLALTGRLDTGGVDAVETRFNAALGRSGHVVVDLSGVTFLSSMGVRLLLTAAKVLDRRGARLVLAAAQPLVEQALRHAAIDEIIPVVADTEEAQALLGS